MQEIESIEFVFEDYRPELIQNAKIKFNDVIIKELVKNIEEKYSNLIITEETMNDYRDLLANINKVKNTLNDYRKEIEKEIKKPLEEFIGCYKDNVLRLENLYRGIKDQVDKFEEIETKNQYNIMVNLRKSICEEMGISELIEVVKLPEQKEKLSRKRFNEKEASLQIKESVERTLKEVEIIKKEIEIVNLRYNANIKLEEFIQYIPTNNYIEKINEYKDCYLKIKKEYEESNNLENKEQKEDEAIKASLYIKICLNSLNKEQLQKLKKCLVENKIEYKKIKE